MDNQICGYNEAKLMPRINTQQAHESFGRRLATLRKAAGLTQEELAKKLGTTRRMIAYYETEVDYQPVALLAQMARVLGLSADELLGLKKDKLNGKKVSRRLLRRLNKIEGLPTHRQKTILQTIDAYLKGVSF